MKRFALAFLGSLMACGVVHANASPRAVRKTAEASMLVTGHVQVNPDGTLKSFRLDAPEKLPAPVVKLIADRLPHWKFTLSGPSNHVVDSGMSLRVLAQHQADGNYALSIEGASFDPSRDSAEKVVGENLAPPPYPWAAIRMRVSGTVYLLLQVGRDGKVQDAIAEQVNLDEYGSELEMQRCRKVLADASLLVARHWTFRVPTAGPKAADPYWVVRMPVHYNLNRSDESPRKPVYGEWKVYIPGPREAAPWADQRLLSEAPDTLPDGALHELGSGLRLDTGKSGG